jgi:hypothetical protein
MRSRVSVPVRVVGRENWGDLASLALSHDICGEKVSRKDDKFSFAGGHRVRLYRFTKNVHWRIPTEVELDITDVTPASTPPRRDQRR